MSKKQQEKPPLTWADPDKVMIAFIISIIFFLIAFVWAINYWAKVSEEKNIEIISLEDCFLKAENGPIIHLGFLEEMYLTPIMPPFLVEGKTLTTLAEIRIETDVKIDDIIPCESNGDPKACNKEFGCRAGMGLCGFISETWNTTLDKMKKAGNYLPKRCWQKVYLPMSKEKTEMIFDGECNRLVGKWLLENEGSYHWGTADTWWGSYKCWSKK